MLLRRDDGRLVELEVYAAPVHDKASNIIASVTAAFDVTERNRSRRLLAQSNADLEERVAEAVTAREAAMERAAQAERVQALGQLAGGIAHDFNNVLQMIEGAGSLIVRRPHDATSVRRLATMLLDAVDRGASVTRRLLAFGRRGDLRAEALDVAAVLNGVQEILTHSLGATFGVDVRLASELPPMKADKGQLETALVNLATNARDAMPDGGRLMLGAEFEIVSPGSLLHPFGLGSGRYVRLTVADTGKGMDTTYSGERSSRFSPPSRLAPAPVLDCPWSRDSPSSPAAH